MDLHAELLKLVDEKYKEFHSKLCPGKDNIMGVRVPAQKQLAKKLVAEGWQEVLNSPVGPTAEEKNIYGLLISYAPLTLTERLAYLKVFVPQIDSWAVCDLVCGAFKAKPRELDTLWQFLVPYLHSSDEYELRFAVVLMLDDFLKDDYIDRVLEAYEHITHEGYYVKMAVAWGLSIAYIKFPDKTMAFFKTTKIDDFTYNKALQKCRESLRISPEAKNVLQSMKRK